MPSDRSRPAGSPEPGRGRRRRGWSSDDLRYGNLLRILRHLRDHGPSSRTDIAAGCGLAMSTMTELIAELRGRRLVRELKGVPRKGAGRPLRPVALDGEPWCALGVQVDLSGIHVLASTVGGEELWSDYVSLPLLHSGPEPGWGLLREALDDQFGRVPEEMTLVAVELALPGYVATDRGTVGWSKDLGWDGLPLQDRVTDQLAERGRAEVAVGVAHDCHLAGLHAVRVELALPLPHVAVYLGGLREVGGALVVDGAVFDGEDGSAGDFGHVNVDPRGPSCPCGRNGCLESLIGPTTLLARSGLVPAEDADTLVTQDPTAALGALLAAADDGDLRVLAVLAEAGDALGLALDDIIGAVNPSVVLLGGYLGVLQRYLLEPARARVARRTAVTSFSATKLIALGDLAPRVVAGAALAARDACLADPLRLTSVVGDGR
ncbi:ROK family protein [uncultured Friedmanniella sp.]|uniref:ROK family protein n=1 Tax=uncultured Friedmanniella sp. TaxID=335381 RepID=UPI0035CC57D1